MKNINITNPFVKTLFLLFILQTIVFTRTQAQIQYGAQVIEPTTYDQVYHVKTTGNDANSGSASSPFKTLGKALWTARNQSLAQGKKTQIKVYPGTYTANTYIGQSNWGNATAKNTLLAIEGQRAAGAVYLQPAGQQTWALRIENKNNLIIRGFNFINGKSNPHKPHTGATFKAHESFDRTPSVRPKNWIIEHCTFTKAKARGAEIYHVDYITIRNCKFNDNGATGLHFAGRYAAMGDLELKNNKEHGILYMGAFYVRASKVDASNNGQYGFRMDHACRDLVITDSKFINNKNSGLIFETCEGPVTIKNSEIANNPVGLSLATAHNITLDGVRFKDNSTTAISIYVRDRTNPATCTAQHGWACTAGDYNRTGVWTNTVPIAWVENITVKNCTMTAKGNALLFRRHYGSNEEFQRWVREEYTGSNNTFYNPDRKNVFETSPNIYGGVQRTYSDLKGWKNKTGSDLNSKWQDPTSTPGTGMVTLRGSNGKFVSSENGNSPMMCNRTQVGSLEKFTLVDLGNGRVAFKGNNGKYVSSENGGRPMNCNRTRIGVWEEFTLVELGGGQIALKGNNGKYVSSEDGGRPMTCNRTRIGIWERFNMKEVQNAAVATRDATIEDNIQIYPNPVLLSKGSVVYINQPFKSFDLHIFNQFHVLVYEEAGRTGQAAVELGFLSPGLYVMRLSRGDKVYTKKLWIQ